MCHSVIFLVITAARPPGSILGGVAGKPAEREGAHLVKTAPGLLPKG
jgi:hypothetical protein